MSALTRMQSVRRHPEANEFHGVQRSSTLGQHQAQFLTAQNRSCQLRKLARFLNEIHYY